MQKPFVKWGLIAGGIGIILSLVFYLINASMMNSALATILTTGVMIYCAVQATKEEREFQGGYMTWGQALVPALLTILVYIVVNLLFSYVLTTLIDPSLIEEQIKAAMEMNEKLMNMMGQEMTDEQIQQIRQRSVPSLMNTLVAILTSMLCLGFPVAAIIAVFLQKKNPEDELLG